MSMQYCDDLCVRHGGNTPEREAHCSVCMAEFYELVIEHDPNDKVDGDQH